MKHNSDWEELLISVFDVLVNGWDWIFDSTPEFKLARCNFWHMWN